MRLDRDWITSPTPLSYLVLFKSFSFLSSPNYIRVCRLFSCFVYTSCLHVLLYHNYISIKHHFLHISKNSISFKGKLLIMINYFDSNSQERLSAK